MRYVKCETEGKKNITPKHLSDCVRRNYYERGGRERMSEYYKSRLTPEQREARRATCREWKARNKDRMRTLRLASNVKSRILIKTGFADFDAWDMIGCNCAELATYLDEQCKDGNMGWRDGRNYEIDHIRALSTFDLSDSSQIRECMHFSNLQVLPRLKHESKTAAEHDHLAWMDSKAREYWSKVRNTEYPGFKIGWHTFCIRKRET